MNNFFITFVLVVIIFSFVLWLLWRYWKYGRIDIDPQSNSESRSRFDPNNPLEDIYRIEIEPNIYITDSKPPSYNEILLENNKDLNKPPPSYLESLEFGKFPLYL